jgi:hypothetical protein
MNVTLRRCAAVALAATVFAPEAATGGAWVQKKDSYYLKVSASYLYTERELDFDGNEVDILSGQDGIAGASYRDIGAAIYLEYGVTDRLTVVGTLPFKVLRSRRTEDNEVIDLKRDVEATTSGLGDMSLGLRYPLRSAPFPLSAYGAARLPLGYERTPENGGPPLGSGRVDLEGSVLAGASLRPFPGGTGYLTGGVGYRVRTGALDDEFFFSIEAGVSWRRLMARFGVDALFSTTDPPNLAEPDGGTASASMVVTNQDILKLTPGLSLSLNEEVSLVLEAFDIVDGKNTVTGTTWSAGVVYRQ